jgi:hypothetical protein
MKSHTEVESQFCQSSIGVLWNRTVELVGQVATKNAVATNTLELEVRVHFPPKDSEEDIDVCQSRLNFISVLKY